MARGLFGRRKDSQPLLEIGGWPQLPGVAEPPQEQPALGAPALAYLISAGGEAATAAPETDLLAKISGLRGAVADELYESSRDYRMLCDMTNAKLDTCDEILEELRRRLTGNTHYAVLAKLDEACALVELKPTSEAAPPARE